MGFRAYLRYSDSLLDRDGLEACAAARMRLPISRRAIRQSRDQGTSLAQAAQSRRSPLPMGISGIA
jgi:hypothetical protein